MGRSIPLSNVHNNVVADKGEDNRVEDVDMLSPVQPCRPVSAMSKSQV